MFGRRPSPTKISLTQQTEIRNLFDDISMAAEQAAAATSEGDTKAVIKHLTTIDRTIGYVENMLRGKGPREIR